MMTRAEFIPPSPRVDIKQAYQGWYLQECEPPWTVLSGPHTREEAERLLAVERLARGQDVDTSE
jgi:hypothetical protein